MDQRTPQPSPGPELAVCDLCGRSQRLPALRRTQVAVCGLCRTPLVREKPNSINRTLAFTVAALLMYFPANLFPIMSFEYYGAAEPTTVMGGAINLANSGMYFVAAVVFLASVAIPLLKLSGLLYLSLSIRSQRAPRMRSRVYRVLKAVGTWAMLDVFLLAILVAAVKLGQLATVRPGPAALPFTLVVVFTIFATESFDSRLLWNHDRPSYR